MHHCSSCFTLNLNEAKICNGCGDLLVSSQAASTKSKPRQVVATKAAPSKNELPSPIRRGARRTTRAKQDVSRWYMPIFSVAALFLLLHIASDGESGLFPPETRANPTSSINLQQIRQAELGDAAQELRLHRNQLESRLVESAEGTLSFENTSPEEAAKWRKSLQDLKNHYRIWGTTDSQHPDAISEDAIRNAHLYLVSMESAFQQASQDQNWTKVGNLKSKFEQNIRIVSAL